MESSVNAQIRLLLETLFSPVGFLALAVYLSLLVTLGASTRAKWVVLSIMLWTATLALFDVSWVDNTLVFPLEQIRHYGRPITVALLVALLVPTLQSGRGWRSNLVLGGTIGVLVFELCLSTRFVLGGLLMRGVAGGLTYSLIFLTLGLGLSQWLQNIRDVHAALWSIAIAGSLFALGNIYQLIINHSAVVFGNRLIATAGNPQATGLVIAVALPPICYLIMLKAAPKYLRLYLTAIVGFLSLFLIWTGSRTGLLMSLIGLGLLFRAHIGRLFAVTIVCGIFLLFAMSLFEDSTQGIERLVSTQNTRSGQWGVLIEEFARSPLVGSVTQESGVLENSYLSTAARTGLIGLAVLLAVMTLVVTSVVRLNLRREEFGEHRLLVDLITAGFVSLGVGACFEGFLLGTLTNQIFVIYIYLAILAFMLDAVDFRAQNQ